MSTDTFVLYSTVDISQDEYNSWLHQLNAVMKPDTDGTYDARLSKDTRHVWVSLLDEEWFEMYMAEFEDEPEVLEEIRQIIGGEPGSAIVLDANNAEGSQILVVQFAALCAERYPCVVYQTAGQALYTAQDVLQLRDAGMSFDGYTWETADPDRVSWDTRIVEEVKRREEAKKQVPQNEGYPFSGFGTPVEYDQKRLGA
jgi:hypothetical protein